MYDIVVVICCRLPDETFFRRVEDALCSWASVLLNLNCLICCEDNKVGHKQSWAFLERAGANFLVYVIEDLMRGSSLLDLTRTRKKWLKVGHVGMSVSP